MYDSHLRIINGKSNKGWLRNCLYSILQQVVRVDPEYYFNYVMLRPDHAHRLVSYPYYCKLAKPGDQTQFRHIDLNIADLVKGRGKDQIQGTVSFTDEDINDCTEMLLGMHRFIGQWHARLVEKNKVKPKMITESHVSRIENDMFDDRDRRDFGIDWTPQPCPAGAVRISRSQLPHGALGPQRKVRITVMPWYVEEREDGTLEIPESGTGAEIAEAHRELLPARNSPSGYPNHYGLVPFAFPAAVEFPSCSNIGDAIIRRKRWDFILVVNDLKRMFHPDPAPRQKLIAGHREHVKRHLGTMLATVKNAERMSFGTKSYWYRKDQGLEAASDDDSNLDPDTAVDPADRSRVAAASPFSTSSIYGRESMSPKSSTDQDLPTRQHRRAQSSLSRIAETPEPSPLAGRGPTSTGSGPMSLDSGSRSRSSTMHGPGLSPSPSGQQLMPDVMSTPRPHGSRRSSGSRQPEEPTAAPAQRRQPSGPGTRSRGQSRTRAQAEEPARIQAEEEERERRELYGA